INPGDVFVALETENDDGHRYVNAAFDAGAVAAVVKARKKRLFSPGEQKKMIAVNDPLGALQRMAGMYRKELGILMLGLTGSNGKTTTRNFIAHVIQKAYPLSQTKGNFNNHIGVPLSILGFSGKEWLGIIEMGANHKHEIHTLSMITRPDIALITNIGYAHIGMFGSLEGTARAKFEIVDGLTKKKGFLLINGDDSRLFKHAADTDVKTISYGFSSRCDIRATDYQLLSSSKARFRVEDTMYELRMPGRHFVYSALPAIFLAKRFGMDETTIAKALKEIRPISLRGTIRKKKGAQYILDCYNANPSSMKSALELLDDVAGRGAKVAIVGDMLELGHASKRLHRQLGRRMFEHGIVRSLAVGRYAGDIAEGAVKAGMKAQAIKTAASPEAAGAIAGSLIRPGNTVLVKGSRKVHLETVYKKI
ncbi:MAG: UDP-N-acetylmuramoyl-tripeptide--D-alanyl-D-alanine ligase, partial [Chitinivibrionales bacterium]|nr:UDP-N-acetylmuramoyl-tripeptide--D-alanyl-D-alanine ligase [Chitinivibrionales bacterium]